MFFLHRTFNPISNQWQTALLCQNDNGMGFYNLTTATNCPNLAFDPSMVEIASDANQMFCHTGIDRLYETLTKLERS